MKKILTSIFVLTLVSGISAQQKSKRITSSDLKKMERTESHQAGAQKNSVKTWDVDQCESYLKSLDQKEQSIKADKEEYELALKEGWFEKAAEERKEVKARLEELK